ncbi:MAG: (d)CMP kinase [bacterium]|nr:(d)CMP kinase [bacterium]MDE0287396.1 (d)CMP kinase [bacterium]MDE0439642.1 (d)CMP kinase [bacterium]
MSGSPTLAEFVIAVDGPGGVGKTTVSRAVAEALGCRHLDTGAFYRAATVLAMLHHLDLSNEAAVMGVIAGTGIEYDDGRIFVEGIDMSKAIRTSAVTARVSRLSTLPGVRMLLVRRQREWLAGRGHRAVVEGRDIGTVVFPQAPLKVFLMARPEVRAFRRAGQQAIPVSAARQRLARRDHLDSTRNTSPLVAADDAIVIDTSDIDFRSVVEEILQLAAERGIRPSAPA